MMNEKMFEKLINALRDINNNLRKISNKESDLSTSFISLRLFCIFCTLLQILNLLN